MRKITFLVMFLALLLLPIQIIRGQEYVPLVISSGFSEDVIAETSPAGATTSSAVDATGTGANNAFMSINYSGATVGLPANGLINSIASTTPGLIFQLASYTEDNSLRINSNGGTGTLVFQNPQSALQIFILATSGSAASNFTGVITFTDNSTQSISSQTVPDWYQTGTNPAAILGIGRVSRSSGNPDNNSTNPKLFQIAVAIDMANQIKLIESISFTKTSSDTGFLNIFGVSAEITPDCPKPTEFTMNGVSAGGATFSWTSLGTDFEIKYGLTGFNVETAGTSVDLNTLNYNLTDVTEGQTYDVYVRRDCGTDGFSNWTGPITFTAANQVTIGGGTGNTNGTGSDPIDDYYNSLRYQTVYTAAELTAAGLIPYNELTELGFSVSEGTGTALLNYTIRIGHTTSSNSSTHITSGDLVTVRNAANYLPTVVPAGEFDMIPFNTNFVWNGEDNIVIDICTGGDNPYSSPYGGVRSHSMTNGSRFIRDDIPGSLCNTNTNSTNSNRPQIRFSFEDGNPPSCLPPSALTATNVISDSAALSWIANGDLFDIEIVEAGDEPTGVPTETGVSNPHTAEGLNPSTTYEYYVRQDCGGGDESYWTGPYSFTTLCIAITTLPYTENFDTYGTGSDAFPDCWERPVTYTSGSVWPSIVSGVAGATANSLRFQSLTTAPVYAVSPAFAEDINNLRVKFKLRREGVNSGSIDIGVMSDPSNLSTFELVQNINPNHNNFEEYLFNLNGTALSGGNNHIAFRHNSNADNWYYWLDDFIVELLPNCLEPTALSVSDIAHDSAVLSWTSDGTLFDIEIVEAGETPTGTPTYTGVDNDFETTTPLTPSTSYEFYVRQDCGTDNTSIWVGPFAFVTECLPPNITGTTPGEACGQGEIELSATADAGAEIAWYAAETGGTKLAEGATFTTPLISTTTSYWVEASEQGGMQSAGKPSSTGANGTFAATTNWGIRFTANEDVTLESVMIYALASGTLNVKVTDSSGTELYETGNITVVNGGVSSPQVIPLNFAVPSGNYRLLVKSTTSGLELVRDNAGLAFPYIGEDEAVSVTSGDNGSATTGAYYYFFDLKYVGKCASERTEVIATITEASDFALSAASDEICEGETSNVVTIATGASEYDTYVWTPVAGVNGDDENGWTFNPVETTTYTLVASQSAGSCATSVEFTVNVSPAPALEVNITEAVMCEGDTPVMLATGVVVEPTLTATGCLTAVNGLYPAATYTPANCNETVYNITTLAYAGEYSNINVIEGNIYTFSSSIATDITTISNSAGTTVLAAGTGNVVWQADFTGVVRMYTHITNCAAQSSSRTRRVACQTAVSTPAVWSPIEGLFTDEEGTQPYTGTEEVVVYAQPATTTIYTASVTSATTNCTATASVTITVPVLVLPTIENQVYCEATSVEDLVFNREDDLVYNWYASATSQNLITTITGSGTYYVEVTSVEGNCKLDRIPVEIVIAQNLEPVVNASYTFCDQATFENIQVGTQYGAAVQWFASADSTTVLPANTQLTTTNYYVALAINDCISERKPVSVTILQTPAPIATQEFTVCFNTPLSQLSLGATNIKWYFNQTSTTALGVSAVAQNNTYYVTTFNGICESARIPVVVNVVQQLQMPAAVTQNFCGSGTVSQLTATGAVSGAEYAWYNSATSTTPLQPTAALQNGTYYVSQKLTNCESPRRPVTVKVTNLTAPTATSFEFCGSATVADLSMPVITGITYNWYLPSQTTPLAGTTNLVTGNYLVSKAENGCESTKTIVQVTIKPRPASPTGSLTQNFIDSAMISDLVMDQSNVIWYVTYEDALNGNNPLQTNMPIEDGHIYYGVLIGSNGCASLPTAVTATITLGVKDLDLASLKYYPNPVDSELTISYKEQIKLIEIYDLLGKQIKVQKFDSNDIRVNVSGLSSGTYMFRVQTNTGSQFIKIIKK